MMYFAVDTPNIATCAQALGAVIAQEQAEMTTPTHWFALLDCAMAHRDAPERYAKLPGDIHKLRNQGLVNLYCKPPLAQLAEFSPALLPLPAAAPERVNVLRRLVLLSSGKPMLSLLCSSVEMDALRDYWQSCVYPECGDDQRLLLRFADTRITPALPLALSPENWAHVCRPLTEWWVINRQGQPERLAWSPMCAPTGAPLPSTPELLCLSQKELDALVAHGQADAIVGFFDEHYPDLLPATRKVAFYEQIQKVCALTTQYGVESFLDITALALASVLTQGQVLESAELLTLLESAKSRSGFSADLNALLTNSMPE